MEDQLSISAITSHSLLGLSRGLQGIERNSMTIAKANIPEKNLDGTNKVAFPDTTKAMVDLSQNKIQVESSLKTLEAADKTTGILLDIVV